MFGGNLYKGGVSVMTMHHNCPRCCSHSSLSPSSLHYGLLVQLRHLLRGISDPLHSSPHPPLMRMNGHCMLGHCYLKMDQYLQPGRTMTGPVNLTSQFTNLPIMDTPGRSSRGSRYVCSRKTKLMGRILSMDGV